MNAPGRRYRAGESLEDFCRACKTDRLHTVIAADEHGQPIRVSCGYCHSEHNYRGGPRLHAQAAATPGPHPRAADRRCRRRAPRNRTPLPRRARARRRTASRSPLSAIAKGQVRRCRSREPDDLELLLRRVIREETGITPVAPAEKWRHGTLVLRPGTPGLQEKTWPIETFFHKVVMLRNRLRTLEQQVNSAELPDDVKVRLQGYISGCYGSLTSFNVLFADEDDQFKGGSSGE